MRYTLTVSNAGPADVIGATVTDQFPAVLTGVRWSCAGSGGATCPADGIGNIDHAIDLPAGGQAVFSVEARVRLGAVGWLVNRAAVTPPPSVTDPDPADNQPVDIDALSVPLFCDDLESGGTGGWSLAQP